MNGSIKYWYGVAYPDDEWGESIITEGKDFTDLWLAILQGKLGSMFNGGYDSLVRERLFTALARKMGVNYDFIYNNWLNNAKD